MMRLAEGIALMTIYGTGVVVVLAMLFWIVLGDIMHVGQRKTHDEENEI